MLKNYLPLQLLLMAAKGPPAYIVAPPPEHYFAFSGGGGGDPMRIGTTSYDYSNSERKNRKSQITASFKQEREQ